VNVGQEGIRSGRQDRAALNQLSLRIPPAVPESGESKQLAAVHFKTVRLLYLAFSLPFIEAVCRNEAALRFKGFPK